VLSFESQQAAERGLTLLPIQSHCLTVVRASLPQAAERWLGCFRANAALLGATGAARPKASVAARRRHDSLAIALFATAGVPHRLALPPMRYHCLIVVRASPSQACSCASSSRRSPCVWARAGPTSSARWRATASSVRALPRRLSGLSVLQRESSFYGAFAWVRRALTALFCSVVFGPGSPEPARLRADGLREEPPRRQVSVALL
jgi:hypothetical protein